MILEKNEETREYIRKKDQGNRPKAIPRDKALSYNACKGLQIRLQPFENYPKDIQPDPLKEVVIKRGEILMKKRCLVKEFIAQPKITPLAIKYLKSDFEISRYTARRAVLYALERLISDDKKALQALVKEQKKFDLDSTLNIKPMNNDYYSGNSSNGDNIFY